MTDKKRGGPGRGQGRKAQYSEPVRGRTVHMTDAQWSTLVDLGGGQAVRDWLDKQAKQIAKRKPQWQRDHVGLFIDID